MQGSSGSITHGELELYMTNQTICDNRAGHSSCSSDRSISSASCRITSLSDTGRSQAICRQEPALVGDKSPSHSFMTDKEPEVGYGKATDDACRNLVVIGYPESSEQPLIRISNLAANSLNMTF